MRPLARGKTSLLLSGSAHLVSLGVLVLLARHLGPVVRPAHMPGTPQGARVMLSYRLGGPSAPLTAQPLPARLPKAPSPARPSRPSASSLAASPAAPTSAPGSGLTGDSALGDENLRIALPQVHPRPQPDLSALPHGTAGDVIVDITIDQAGKVVETTLVKGLGESVDRTVLATLQGWTFTPANKDGQNVASEQEILIHYERA